MEEELANLFKKTLNEYTEDISMEDIFSKVARMQNLSNEAVLNKVEIGLFKKLDSQCPEEVTEWENVSNDKLDDIYFLLEMIRTIKIIKIKTSN